MSNLYSIGHMNQLADALERHGFTPDDVTQLKQSDLGAVRSVMNGLSEIKPIEFLIDCDARPFEPSGLTVESHKKNGKLAWDPGKIKLYLSRQQRGGKYIKGYQLRKELEEKPVLNANILDYLLARQDLIPEDWKGKYVFFWGTIYRNSGGDLCVRGLYFGVGRWKWYYSGLLNRWSENLPAALLAS